MNWNHFFNLYAHKEIYMPSGNQNPNLLIKTKSFWLFAYVYPQASLWIQTKINKYANFLKSIARLHKKFTCPMETKTPIYS